MNLIAAETRIDLAADTPNGRLWTLSGHLYEPTYAFSLIGGSCMESEVLLDQHMSKFVFLSLIRVQLLGDLIESVWKVVWTHMCTIKA